MFILHPFLRFFHRFIRFSRLSRSVRLFPLLFRVLIDRFLCFFFTCFFLFSYTFSHLKSFSDYQRYSVESRPAIMTVRMRARSTHVYSGIIEGGERRAPLACSFSKGLPHFLCFFRR